MKLAGATRKTEKHIIMLPQVLEPGVPPVRTGSKSEIVNIKISFKE